MGFASDPSLAQEDFYASLAKIQGIVSKPILSQEELDLLDGKAGQVSVSGLMLWKSTRMESQHNPITGQDIRPFEDINVFLSILSGQMCKYIKRIQKISEDWNT